MCQPLSSLLFSRASFRRVNSRWLKGVSFSGVRIEGKLPPFTSKFLEDLKSLPVISLSTRCVLALIHWTIFPPQAVTFTNEILGEMRQRGRGTVFCLKSQKQISVNYINYWSRFGRLRRFMLIWVPLPVPTWTLYSVKLFSFLISIGATFNLFFNYFILFLLSRYLRSFPDFIGDNYCIIAQLE